MASNSGGRGVSWAIPLRTVKGVATSPADHSSSTQAPTRPETIAAPAPGGADPAELSPGGADPATPLAAEDSQELEQPAPGTDKQASSRPRQSGVRAVLARLPMLDLGPQVPERLQPLMTTLKANSPKVDGKAVLRAYEVADSAHQGQKRQSGEPYIIHPVGVAELLAELGMDTPTIVAALLHDVVEDTEMSVDDVARDFGPQAAALVDGVTKLDRISTSSKEEQQAESLRKMLIAMASDARVLLIKLADRLHNLITIHHLPRDKQKRIATETLSIYAPLAHRLGMQTFKWRLEDLSFATLHPKRYDEIKAMVADRQPQRDRYLEEVVAEVDERLRSVKLRTEVTGRPKHYYSIYEKMVVRGKEFSDIYDLVGLRVIVDSVKDCYAALGTLHAMWRPIPGRFKDYIAMPKFNLYQSLHTTVVGPTGKPIEVQIRTRSMHRTAEFGIAAHWKYKSVSRADSSRQAADGDAQWLTQMLDWQSDTADSGEFMHNMRLDLYADEVFVFTPKGDVTALPRGSTPVDFAYSVHTEVGHRTVGARVNGRLVALEYELRNGDKVEILTSKAADAGPSRDWLEFLGSSRARSKVKQWFSRERRIDAIEKGREEVGKALAKQGMGWKRLVAGSELAAVAEQMNYKDLEALYRAVGDGHLGTQAVINQLLSRMGGDEDDAEEVVATPTAVQAPARSSEAVVVEDTDDVWVTLARCCTPVPRDDILGFVTRGRGVSVHRTDCSNAADLKRDPERLIPVRWDTTAQATFRVTVQVEALDRKHLLRDITTVLGDLHVNILGAQVTTQRDRVAYLRFTFELGDIAHLDHILEQVRRIEAVFDAYRVVPRPPKATAANAPA
ncbi:MAG: bifunctional (p)ppGpp synthetase/guanosine-3',5'-bis(diphosphate) 3'-pyrophosphohydrolase [Euzebyaceae bacterium]|nr:bifunctional (p)ppGpp synthetase/guanosine-3',5'-bis(diphosphate) 3'-pyrophosphohydrolase [Euzebyaceae bacterium]